MEELWDFGWLAVYGILVGSLWDFGVDNVICGFVWFFWKNNSVVLCICGL